MSRPLHVVQVGYDDSVFVKNAPSDTLRRQVGYGRELERQRPGSLMTVLMFTRNPNASRFQEENVVFVPVRGRRPHELLKLLPCLIALQRERPIDVIATQTIYYEAWIALLFGRLHGVNVIGQAHYDFFTASTWVGAQGRDPLTTLRRWMGYRLMRRLSAMRVVSHRVRDRMLAEKLHENVHVVGLPVSMSEPADLELRLASREPKVLFVGRLVEVKRLDEWLRVAALVAAAYPLARFELVGGGPLRSRLEALAAALGLSERVHFRGFASYDELPALYGSAAVFLITSQSEGLPRVIMEASLQGVTVVGPRIAGVEDIVEDGKSGFLHESGDIEGIAASVVKLLTDGDLRRQMGRTGNQIVRDRFSAERLSREWVSLLISGVRRNGH